MFRKGIPRGQGLWLRLAKVGFAHHCLQCLIRRQCVGIQRQNRCLMVITRSDKVLLIGSRTKGKSKLHRVVAYRKLWTVWPTLAAQGSDWLADRPLGKLPCGANSRQAFRWSDVRAAPPRK